MTTVKLIIDGNSLGHAAQAAKKLHVGSNETQAIYGFLRTMRGLMERYPQGDPVVLWDGRSWRHDAFETYKSARDKNETAADQQKQAEKAAFAKQRPHIKTALKLLGVPQLVVSNYEADDLAGVLVERAERAGDTVLLVSGDQDWIQLIGPKVVWFDPIRDKTMRPKDLFDKYGVDTPAKFLQMKALQGDDGDSLPGVGGIGPKGAAELLMTFGSVTDMLNLSLEGGLPAKMPKKILDFIDCAEKQEIFRRNMRLMDLRSGPHRPAPARPLLTKEPIDPEKFRVFCTRLMFNRFLTAFDEWIFPFHRAVNRIQEMAA